jgi:CheY-like chemotaxis protein
MREHNGFMTLESRPERGTTVSLYFPVSDNAVRNDADGALTEAAAADSSSLEQLRGNNQTILVLESQDELRGVLSDTLSALGYRPSVCTDKQEAMERIEANDVDILLVDEALSDRFTQDIIAAVRQNGKIKSVLMTTSADGNTSATDGTVMKPFDVKQLGRVLQSVTMEQNELEEAEPADRSKQV